MAKIKYKSPNFLGLFEMFGELFFTYGNMSQSRLKVLRLTSPVFKEAVLRIQTILHRIPDIKLPDLKVDKRFLLEDHII